MKMNVANWKSVANGSILAAISIAMAFTFFACSSDSDNSGSSGGDSSKTGGACNKMSFEEPLIEGTICAFLIDYHEWEVKQKARWEAECSAEFNGEWLSQCPAGYVLKCHPIGCDGSCDENGVCEKTCTADERFEFYYYGEAFRGFTTCEQLEQFYESEG